MNLYRMPDIHSGPDAIRELGKVLDALAVRRVQIVTGPNVSRSQGFAALEAVARENGRSVSVFARTTADPTVELVEEIGREGRAFAADCVIGVGGGSPLDAAKIAAVLAEHDMPAADLMGNDRVPTRRIPLLLVPTTAGTASEVTIYSILTDTASQIKTAVCSRQIIPDHAFLIPELTYSMPPHVTAATGMDALCHAAESHLSLRRNPYSDVMGLAAIRLIGQNLLTAQREPTNPVARGNMLQASLFAGLAFGNASVTAVHAFAYPLGGMHHIPHGLANSLMFTPVFRHNLPGNEARMAAIAEALCGERDAQALIPAVQELKQSLGMPLSLQQVGIPLNDIPAMARSVMGITRLLNVNPNPISPEDALRIYTEAYHGS